MMGSEAIKDICSMWGYRDELEELNNTIATIKNVLLDADYKRDRLHVQQGYIVALKNVVYDAEDLFDEFHTLAKLNEIGDDKEGKFFGKLRHFFSSEKNKVSQARRMCRRVRDIKVELDGIASDYTRLGFSVDYRPIVRRREESCSYVDVMGIIGRDKDKNDVIDILFDPNGDDDAGFKFLTIVGVGGLGKTALAQLVYSDKKIEKEFSNSRFWVCVSDQDGVEFDVKTILSKIVEAGTKKRLDNSSSMELVLDQFQKLLEGKKYFLVLDDVWNEDHDDWVKLKSFLKLGAKGSRIVVTSPSENTGSSIGNMHIYTSEGLSKEDSQYLFELSAFDKGEKHPKLVMIGKRIASKCCGIPLALKVLGSLLYGQGISKWESIERSGLVEIDKEHNVKIFSILKLSYYNLAPSLKCCFSYCAIFLKDYKMDNEMLIGLWMAQDI